MADTTFAGGTVISAAWLNDLNKVAYRCGSHLLLNGGVADGVTDNTSAILAAGAASGAKVILVPPNAKFNRKSVLTSLATGVVMFDLSSINDFAASGETTKHIGFGSSDTDSSDTHFSIDSGHHSIIALNNFGTSGTTSASERKASFIWNVGQFETGSDEKKGFRGAVIQQYTKITGTSYWAYVQRSLAPWAAIAGNYELWRTGDSIAGAGYYRYTGDNHYVSASAGTIGATMPTHTTGTVSDGGVDWTWVDSADRTVSSLDQYGRLLIGTGADGPTFRHKVERTDPTGGAYVGEIASTGVSKVVIWRGTPTDASSVASSQPYLQWQDGYGLRFMKKDGSGDLGSVTDNGWLMPMRATTIPSPAAIASAGTISVSAVTPVNFVSGTAAIATINIPTLFASSGGEIILIPTGAFTTTTAGNIAIASTAVVGKALRMVYDSGTNKWYPSY